MIVDDASHSYMTVSGAVEGPVDEAVWRRLINHVSGQPGNVYGKNGKKALLKGLPGYNKAAQRAPWLILIDLDNEPCVVDFCKKHLPHPSTYLCFRVAVHEIEAWLLADRERLAKFLHIREGLIPENPDAIVDPKRLLVDLARKSSRDELRKGMVPRPGQGEIGPAYVPYLIRFISDSAMGWRPEVAARTSESLRRCIECLKRLLAQYRQALESGA